MGIAGNRRVLIFAAITLLLFAILIMQLADLTLAKGSELDVVSESRTKRTLPVKAARGSIMDKNGIPLAYDEKSYNVQFMKDPTRTSSEDRAFYTDVLMKAVDIIESNGGKIINTFNVKRDVNGVFSLDFKTDNSEVRTKREERWRKDMYVSNLERYPDALSIYHFLRKKYQIPEELSYEEAVKLLSIWQEVQLNAGSMYQPVDIAYNVNIQAVARLETYANILEGIQVAEGTTRVYPRSSTAAHVIGYLGKMNNNEKIEEMEKLGYGPGDLIGVGGIEQTMEAELTSNTTERLGSREVEISRNGKIIRELGSTIPTSGNSVMLTIDLKLQLALEDVLADNIRLIYNEQQRMYKENKAEYDELVKERGGREIDFAESGAAVVLDVNTGKVLAMASYPSYDLNLFTGGISEEDYKPLRESKASPLFNKAVSSKATPGSIFKMCTAVAGLMENAITVDERISDLGPYDKYVKYGKAPQCWGWPYESKKYHQNQNLSTALKNSCNYYFFTVADRLGIDKLNKWADKLGLTSKTGIELPLEATGQVGNQQLLYDNTRAEDKQYTSIPKLVFNKLKELLKGYGKALKVDFADSDLDKAADAILRLVGTKTETGEMKTELGPDIRRAMRETLGISERSAFERNWDDEISSVLYELAWNPNRTIVSGIGQGVAAVTPVEVARYMAAIVNGGTVYNLHIVDKILAPDGTIIREVQPEVFGKLGAKKEYLEAIKIGMAEVVNPEDRGTAQKYFKDYEYRNDMGGKTGTAEVSKIDIENNSWFGAFVPKDKPEIVVVAFIPHGYSGGLSSLVAKDIITYYMDSKKRKAIDDIPTANSIVGDLYKFKEDADQSEDE